MAAHKHIEDIENDLHRLLLFAVPSDSNGHKTIVNLAKLLGMSRSSIWKWVRAGRIPPNRALQIVHLSEGRVSREDFMGYVFYL
jgi:hypothetical protein